MHPKTTPNKTRCSNNRNPSNTNLARYARVWGHGAQMLCCLLLLSGCFATPHTSVQTTTGPSPSATQKPYVINNIRYYPIPSAEGYSETGIASWYGADFHGKRTSNGEIYDMHAMTAAHKTLPMNTMVLIKNLDNGKNTVVRINDRGPFVQGRIVDLSYKAAQSLGIARQGLARVELVALGKEAAVRYGGQPPLIHQNLYVGTYFVQIGAFSVRDNALRLQKRFTAAGHRTEIQSDDQGKRTIHRVQVYAGTTLQDARRAENALLERGWVGAFVVAR